MKVYIKGRSKKELNERLENGFMLIATEYNVFNPLGYETFHKLEDLKNGTAISIFEERQQGNPISKSYGLWDKERNQIV